MTEKIESWTPDVVEKFTQMFPTATWTQLVEEFGLCKYSLSQAAIHFGITRRKRKQGHMYSAIEDEFIKTNYLLMSDAEIGMILNRSQRSVKSRRNELGMHKKLKYNIAYENTSIYVRRHNQEWKKDSMTACHFRCIITGERFDEIHHLVSLNTILTAVYNTLGLDADTFDINKISEQERRVFLDAFYKEQNKYPLGICLCKSVHIQFHSIYGYGNNTLEQFEEFLKQYYPDITLHIS